MRFQKGHTINVGKKHFISNETRAKISRTLMGRHLSAEIRSKISKTTKGRKQSLEQIAARAKGLIGRIGGMTGKRHSLETRKQMSKSAKQYLKIHPRKSYRTSRLSTHILNEIEKQLGIKIEREFWIDGKSFDGRWKKMLIEIDGVYWHSLPRVKENDELKNQIAEKYGFRLHRIQTNKNLNSWRKENELAISTIRMD